MWPQRKHVFPRKPRPGSRPSPRICLGGVVGAACLGFVSVWKPRHEPSCKNRLGAAAGKSGTSVPMHPDSVRITGRKSLPLQANPIGDVSLWGGAPGGRPPLCPFFLSAVPVLSSRVHGGGGEGRGGEEGCCMPGCKCNPPTMCLSFCCAQFLV